MPRLGSKVVLVEALDTILAGADPDLARPVVAYAKKAFKEVRLKTKVGKMATSGKQIKVEFDIGRPEERGALRPRAGGRRPRRPTPRTSAWKTPRCRSTTKGFIHVNEKQQTTDPAIYAIGDIAGGVLLAHKASKEARIAVEVIAGEDSAFADVTIPAVVFTDPEAGLVRSDRSRSQGQRHRGASGQVPLGRFRPRAVLRPPGRHDQADHRSGHRAHSGRRHCRPRRRRTDRRRRAGRGDGRHGQGPGPGRPSAPDPSETLMEAAEAFYGHATHTMVRKKPEA